MKISSLSTILLFFICLEFSPFCDAADAPRSIRKTQVLDSSVNLKNMGYSAREVEKMLALKWQGQAAAEDTAWGGKRGWAKSTTQIYSNMLKTNWRFNEQGARVVINVCKAFARDPQHCIVMLGSVACAESSCANPTVLREGQGNNKNFFGLRPGGVTAFFPSFSSATKCWVTAEFCAPYIDNQAPKKTYNQAWFVANEGFFYGYCETQVSPSVISTIDNHRHDVYCLRGSRVREDVKTRAFYTDTPNLRPYFNYCLSEGKGDGQCPNGVKNSTAAYDLIIGGIKK
jgi:hypothetical protein